MNEPTFKVEQLLSHSEWVYALARSLSTFEDSAADLAQDTLRHAIERPPKHSGNLKAWLRKVASHIAIQRARSDRRRVKREQENALSLPSAEPSTADLAARAELQQKLVGLVLELSEHERAVILWRFYHGSSLEDIARREGVPSATIRSRLRRALEHLRRRLEGPAKASGDFRRVLVPLLLPAPPDLSLLTTAVAGGAVMTTLKLVVPAAILAVAALGWFLVTTQEGPGTVERAGPSGSSTLHDDEEEAKDPAIASAAASAEQPEVRRKESGEPDPAETPLYSISGKVIDDRTQLPIEGATIRAKLWRNRKQVRTTESSTDVNGRYELVSPQGSVVQLRAEKDGYFHAFWPIQLPGGTKAVFPPGSSLVERFRDLKLVPAVPLTGRVLDRSTLKGVASAKVCFDHPTCPPTCVNEPAITGRGGEFEFAAVPVSDRLLFTVEAPGYAEHRLATRIYTGLSSPWIIEIDRGTAIDVDVLDLETGRPVSGVRVTARGIGTLSHQIHATTSDDGQCTLLVPVVETMPTLVLDAPGYCELQRSLESRDGSAERLREVFWLVRPCRVEGAVLSEDGSPVANVHVAVSLLNPQPAGRWALSRSDLSRLDPMDRLFSRSLVDSTDDQGLFAIESVAPSPEPVTLIVSENRAERARVDDLWIEYPGSTVHRDVHLAPAGSLEGVVLVNGEPWKEGVLWRSGSRSGARMEKNLRGEFALSGLMPGSYELQPALGQRQRWLEQVPSRLFEVKAGATTFANLEVTYAFELIAGTASFLSGGPSSGTLVTVARSDLGSYYGLTDRDGRWSIDVPLPGDYDLFSYDVETRVQAGDRDVRLVFERFDQGKLLLRVLAEDTREPLFNYRILLMANDDLNILHTVGGTIFASPDGLVELSVPAHTYTLEILPSSSIRDSSRPGFARVEWKGIDVPLDGSSGPHEILVSTGAQLEIEWRGFAARLLEKPRIVLLVDAAEVDSTQVFFNDSPGTRPFSVDSPARHSHEYWESRKVTVDSTSSSTLRGLPPGMYRLCTWPQDLFLEPSAIEVPGPGVKSVTIEVKER